MVMDSSKYKKFLEDPRHVDISNLKISDLHGHNLAKIALDFALDYSTAKWSGKLFRDIVAEFNYTNGNYFGVYKPAEDLPLREELLNLVYKEDKEKHQNIYGVSFGINLPKIVSYWKNQIPKVYKSILDSEFFKKYKEELLNYHLVLEIAATMVHEARHAILTVQGNKLVPGTEGQAKAAEKDFLNWAASKTGRKLQLMKDIGIPVEYAEFVANPTG